MFQAFLLVCSMNTAHMDCKPDTAIHSYRGPTSSSVVMCGFTGQAYAAQSGIQPKVGEYLKLQCVELGEGNDNNTHLNPGIRIPEYNQLRPDWDREFDDGTGPEKYPA